MRYRHIQALLLFFGVMCALKGQAQRIAPIGTWTPYVSHFSPNDLVRNGNTFYVRTEGGLFTYDINSRDTKAFSPVEGLSDVSPSAIYYDSTSGFVFVGFDDGMVNYFRDPEDDFEYLTEIRRTDLFTTKRINNFFSHGNNVYIATEFGIVIFDTERLEIKSSITKIGPNPSGTPVKDLCIVEDTLYVSMGVKGVHFTSVNQPNITLPDVWEVGSGNRGLPTGNSSLCTFVRNTVYVVLNDTIYSKPAGSDWIKSTFPNKKYHYFDANGDYLKMAYDNIMRVKAVGIPQYNILHDHRIKAAYLDSNYVFLCDSVNGLLKWYARDSFDVETPDGPFNNKVTQIAAGNREMYIGPEARTGTAPAGNFDGFYHFNPEKGWRRFEVDDELLRDSAYAEFGRAYYYPKDNRFFLGSWNHGIVEMTDGEITGVWTPKNSNLSGSANISAANADRIRVSGLDMDNEGRLWATGALADFNINCLTPDDRQWHQMRVPGTTPMNLLVDDWGNKWMLNLSNGLSIFNENGTLDDLSDDQWRLVTADAGNGGLPSANVQSFAKDLKGHIWVGTLEGVGVFASPGSAFSGNMSDASCPVIDGFCLLRDQRVSTIAVDGANRKWLGTNNGVYVVNPQGNRLIHHYTTENSPIFSDEIRHITIDQGTGEVFIGTSKGVLSLMGDATGGKETSDDLYVFPNPIPFDYDGTVAISSSVRDAEVRITDVAGRLVRALDALGGQTVWDFRDTAGNRLRPGVYIALVADSDGKNAGYAKFVVLEQQQ